MFELKVALSKLVQAALEAGRKADFEGAILLLARGLSTFHQRELIVSWSDLDDITHNDILVLTFGVSKNLAGITPYSEPTYIITDEVSVAYPSSEEFSENFKDLLHVADYIPRISNYSHNIIIDSHGATEIRRTLGLAERQLPALVIVSYRYETEYIVELGPSEIQLSPTRFISALASNLDDVPYKYRILENETKRLFTQRSQLWRQIEKKRTSLKNLEKNIHKPAMRGQLESVVYHINQALVDAPHELKNEGERIIEFLSGKDEDLEQIKYYESSLIKYALSQDKSALAGRLSRKLPKAIDRRLRNEPFNTVDEPEGRENKRRQLELELSQMEEQRTILQLEEDSLNHKYATLNIETAFISALETTLKQFKLTQRPQDNQRNPEPPHLFGDFPRMTYFLATSASTEIEEAEVLFARGHYRAAGSIAGVALEQHLKTLCDTNGLTYNKTKDTIDSLATILYRADKLDKTELKHIQYLASIRNNCSHSADLVSEKDVNALIEGVRKIAQVRDSA